MVNKRLINTGEAAPAPFDPLQNFETVTYTGNGGTQKITGYIRKGAAFNGSSSYISGLPILTNVSDSFSVSMWVNFASAPSTTEYIFGGIKEQGTEDSLIGIFVNTSGYIGANARGSNNGTVYSATSTSSFADGNWHHVVYTLNSSILQLYIDNSQIGSDVSISSATVTVDNSVLGAINSRGTIENYFNGSIDQVRIFDKALDSGEVGELALETYADPKKSTTDYFGDGSGVALYELDDDANDTGGTYNGTPTNVNFLGMAFQPDLVWIKNRNDSFFWHNIWDSVRGVNKGLFPNVTAIEDNQSPRGYLSSFDTNGFTVTSGTTDAGNNNGIGKNIVAWCWKAADTTTTIAANTIGNTIASDVRANTDAGFSIVKYTGNGTSGSTIGHGLSSSPEFIIVKNLSELFNWMTFAEPIGADFFCEFNESNQFQNTTDEIWKDTLPTSTIFTVGNNATVNKLNNNYIAYCFHSVDGYQKVGSYSGGSSGSSNVIATGFKPRFLLVKRTDASGDAWQMFDSIRGGGDTFDNYLQANEAYAETSYSLREVNFADNGFYWTNAESGTNISGGTYIYLAIA